MQRAISGGGMCAVEWDVPWRPKNCTFKVLATMQDRYVRWKTTKKKEKKQQQLKSLIHWEKKFQNGAGTEWKIWYEKIMCTICERLLNHFFFVYHYFLKSVYRVGIMVTASIQNCVLYQLPRVNNMAAILPHPSIFDTHQTFDCISRRVLACVHGFALEETPFFTSKEKSHPFSFHSPNNNIVNCVFLLFFFYRYLVLRTCSW